MYGIIPKMDMAALTQLIYKGIVEKANGSVENSDVSIPMSLQGSRYEQSVKNIQQYYTPRISWTILRNLYSLICRGNANAQYTVHLLYRVGIGVPQDDRLSALWHEMPTNGSVVLPDGTVITYKDLKYVLKQHLKEANSNSLLFVYPKALVDFYKKVFDYIKPYSGKGKVTRSDKLYVQGCTGDVALTYFALHGTFYLKKATLSIDGKVYDFTAQSKRIESIPKSFENKISNSLENTRIAVVGKFIFSDTAKETFDKAQVDEIVQKMLDLDTSSLSDEIEFFELNHPNRAWLKKNDERYRSARSELRSLKKNSGDSRRIKALSGFIAEFESKQSQFKSDVENRREFSRQNEPTKVLKFVSYDFVRIPPNVNRTLGGKHWKEARANYNLIVSKLKELGFATMPYGDVKKRPYMFKHVLNRSLVAGNIVWIKE